MIEFSNFVDVVSRMREAQKEYFRTRDSRILIRAKNLESAVDSMINEYEAGGKKTCTQLDLFG